LDELKDIPLNKKIHAAIAATEAEKYEVLQEISKTLSPEEKEFFWEVVNIVTNSIKKNEQPRKEQG